MAAEETVGVVQGLTVELEVYVSGFPMPTSSQITWYHPDRSVISNNDPGMVFQDGGRKLIISNVQSTQAGLYECEVLLSPSPPMFAMTSIMLQVYGELIHNIYCQYHAYRKANVNILLF